MLYFTLPEMVNNLKINTFLINLHEAKPEYFKYDIQFFSINGNFNYTLWNGEINNNYGKFLKFRQLNIAKKYNIPVRFNCSNILLINEDFDDEYMNIILMINKNRNGYIELNDFKLMDYIKNKYPQYKFILSFTSKYTINDINNLLDQFDLIKLPIDFINLEQIKNKEKIELIINPNCLLSCSKYDECDLLESQYHNIYSNKSVKNTCQLNNNNIFNLNTNFKYFSFSQGNFNPYFYINFFIKEEYQYQTIKEYNND